MTLEAIHKLLKYFYLGGVQCRRLDKGIQACMKLAFDAKFKRLIKLKRNKATEKLRRIYRSHEESQRSEFSISPKDSNNWLVNSRSKDGKFYEVTKILEVCDENYCALKCKSCNTCIHMYLCQCKDNVQRFNICKHIHAVASQFNDTIQFNDSSNMINDDQEIEIYVNDKAQEIFDITDPSPVSNDDLSDQILVKAKKIVEVARTKLSPIENNKMIVSLLDKVLLKMVPENGNKSSTNRTCLADRTNETIMATKPKKLEKQKCYYSTKKPRNKKKPFSQKRFAISEVHAEHLLNSLQHDTEISIITAENIEHSYSQKEN